MQPMQQQQQLRSTLPWKRMTIGCTVTLLLGLAGLTWVLSIGHIIDGVWSYIFTPVFVIAAILVPFWQALFPSSANASASAPAQTVPPSAPPAASPLPAQPAPVATSSTAATQASPPQQSTPPSPVPASSSTSTTAAPAAPPLPTIFYFNTPHLPNVDELYGRRRERITLLDRTRKGLCTSIVGPRRIGKTWLIDYLKLAAATQLDTSFHFATLDGTMPQCQTVAEFCSRVFDAFGVPFGTANANMDMLGRYVREQRVRAIMPVLCIDEFEGFFDKKAFDCEFFAGLRYIAANDGLVLVIGSRSQLIDLVSEHCKTSPFFNIFGPLVLKPFTQAEAEEFAQKKSTEAGWNDVERTALLKYGQEQKNQQSWPALRLQLVGQMLLEDKHLAATGAPDYYRPGDTAYWREFEQRLEEQYRGVVRR